jgi:hypothetical protein
MPQFKVEKLKQNSLQRGFLKNVVQSLSASSPACWAGVNVMKLFSFVTGTATFSIMTVSIECHYAECRYAECRYAECRYAECCGASSLPQRQK